MQDQDTQSRTERARGIDLSSAPEDVRATLNRIMYLEDERDRYREALERIGRVHGPWRAVVADALGCSVDDLDPRQQP
jgi:hypothetical protein